MISHLVCNGKILQQIIPLWWIQQTEQRLQNTNNTIILKSKINYINNLQPCHYKNNLPISYRPNVSQETSSLDTKNPYVQKQNKQLTKPNNKT